MNPGKHIRSFEIAGRARYYVLLVPPHYDPAVPLPVVLAIHGAMSNPKLMEKFSGLTEFAAEAGFLLVYPAGTGNTLNVLTWNAGKCCGYALRHDVDELAYFRRLLEDLQGAVAVDANRIYLSGMSNGAHMTYRLAVEMPEPWAALACVAGPMTLLDRAAPRPIPLLHIHGTKDEFAPFAGGFGPLSVFHIEMPSIPETIAYWVNANQCDPTPSVDHWPDRVGDGMPSVVSRYQGAADVMLVAVQNGGHTWPGRPPLPNTLGPSTMNFQANEVIWDFFRQHGRR